jgi:hypothetical protein
VQFAESPDHNPLQSITDAQTVSKTSSLIVGQKANPPFPMPSPALARSHGEVVVSMPIDH